MKSCTSPRDRSNSTVDVQSSLLGIQRAIKLQEDRQDANYQHVVDKLDAVIQSVGTAVGVEKEYSVELSSALRKQVIPLEAKLDALLGSGFVSGLKSIHDRVGENQFDGSLKKHLEPIHSYLINLHELLSKISHAQEGAELSHIAIKDFFGQAKTAGSPEVNTQDIQVHLRQEIQALELQAHLRQEIQALEKSITMCIEDKFLQLEERGVISAEGIAAPPNGATFGSHQLTGRSGAVDVDTYARSKANVVDNDPMRHQLHALTHNLSLRDDEYALQPIPNETSQKERDDLSAKPAADSEVLIPRSDSVPSRGKNKVGQVRKFEDVELKVKDSTGIGAVFFSDTSYVKKPYHADNFYKTHGVFQKIARSPQFDTLSHIVIFANAVYIGAESDHNDGGNLYKSPAIFIIMATLFAVFFTAELLIRYLAFEKTSYAFNDGWFKFDTFLVSTMILETWIAMPVLLLIAGEDRQFKIPTQPLRILRLLKILRMARLMKLFPELVTMVLGLVRSVRAIFSTMILIIFMMYVWAIFLHMLMKNEEEMNYRLQNDYQFDFKSIGDCLWTLLMDGVLQLDNAALVMTTLVFAEAWKLKLAGLAFTFFSLLSSLLILQMLIGVMCDVVAQVGLEQRQAKAIAILKGQLQHEFAARDNGDGLISQSELNEILESEGSALVFSHLKINPVFYANMASLFYEGSDAAVPIKTLLEVMILCKGDGMVTVDLLSLVVGYLDKTLLELENRLSARIDNK